MNAKRIWFFVAIWISTIYAGATQDIYFPAPGKDWKTVSPESLGLNTELVDSAVSFALNNEYSGEVDLRIAILDGFSREPFHEILGPTKKRGGPTGMILKDGILIAAWGDIDRVDMTFSVTKSYLSTVAGLAIDHNLIHDVADHVKDYVWDGTFAGQHNEKITWHHLLNQSSDWSGTLFGLQDWADRPPRDGDIVDWEHRQLHEPGTHYKYNDVRVNVLAYSLLHVWRQPLPSVIKEHVMDPIGASSTWRWFGYQNSWVTIDGVKMQSVSGGGHSGGGMFISARDHARFGLLFMNNGNWDGEQLISSEWVQAVQQSSEANTSYGYMWWLNRGDRANDQIPEHIYWAAGFGGNYIVVDSVNNLVLVTRWLNPSKLRELQSILWQALD